MDQYAIIARLISAVMSWIDSSNLRNQMYAQQSRIEVLETALEDIERISASRVAVSEQHRLIVKIIETTLK
jgi:uncharacterized secreted protein with C-terminal beta-propeller domain